VGGGGGGKKKPPPKITIGKGQDPKNVLSLGSPPLGTVGKKGKNLEVKRRNLTEASTGRGPWQRGKRIDSSFQGQDREETAGAVCSEKNATGHQKRKSGKTGERGRRWRR